MDQLGSRGKNEKMLGAESRALAPRCIMGAMATLYAGTSGYAYPAWKPGFYPAKMPSNQFLKHYSERLNCVEITTRFDVCPPPTRWRTGWKPQVRDSCSRSKRTCGSHIF